MNTVTAVARSDSDFSKKNYSNDFKNVSSLLKLRLILILHLYLVLL